LESLREETPGGWERLSVRSQKRLAMEIQQKIEELMDAKITF